MPTCNLHPATFIMINVLLLNASYEPLSVLPLKRAMSLWVRGRVDGVSEDAIEVRAAESGVSLPRVLRLRKYVKVPRRKARWSRMGVLRRDAFTCIYCGIKAGEMQKGRTLGQRDFTIDHIVPKSRNGKNAWGNTACACAPCNGRKGNRLPHEAGMKLLWEPKIPRVDYLVAAGDIPDSWKIYLEV